MPRKAKAPQGAAEPLVQKEIVVSKEQSTGMVSNIFDQDGELVVDVFETQKDFVVLAAIAGVQIKDLDISIEKEMMVIKGRRPDPHSHPENKYVYQECYWGPFSRKIVLPEHIDTENADAQMDKGMLTIKIPKLSGEPEKGNVEVA